MPQDVEVADTSISGSSSESSSNVPTARRNLLVGEMFMLEEKKGDALMSRQQLIINNNIHLGESACD